MPPKTPKTKEIVAAVAGAESEDADCETSPTQSSEAETKSAPTPKSKTPRKKAATKAALPVYKTLTSSLGDAAPVDVLYQGDTEMSQPDATTPGQSFQVKLAGPRPFKLITSVILPQGHQYAGYQALVIKPAQPFNFNGLPISVRNIIYNMLLVGEEDDKYKIVISPRSVARGGGIIAKSYTKDQKNRLSILHVCKQITAEARPVLYGMPFKFDNTNVLLAFLTSCGEPIRALLQSVELTQYQKIGASPAMSMLADCRSLQRLHISTGVALRSSPSKAATAFFAEASHFLRVIGSTRGRKDAGLEILRFGRSVNCFSVKEGADEPRPWDAEEKEEFQDLLRGKLQ